jgi:hypothetical protein
MASTLIFMKIIFQATHHAAAKPPHTPRLIGCSAARLLGCHIGAQKCASFYLILAI